MPGPVHPIAVAQKDIDRKPTASWRVDILAERAVGSRVARHLVPHPPLVRECFVDGSLCDDDESGVIVVQKLQPGELGGEPGAARTLPVLTREPHVVVDDQLPFTVEYIDQPHRSVLGFQYIVRHLNHRQPSSLCGDGVELAGGRLFPDAKGIQCALPGFLVHDGWQSCGFHEKSSDAMFTPSTW